MNERCAVDVLICGAGAAGLTLAIDLARRGITLRLIEKSPQPFHGSRGKGIQPRSQEVFEDLGVLDRLVAMGESIRLNGATATMAASVTAILSRSILRHRPSPINSR